MVPSGQITHLNFSKITNDTVNQPFEFVEYNLLTGSLETKHGNAQLFLVDVNRDGDYLDKNQDAVLIGQYLVKKPHNFSITNKLEENKWFSINSKSIKIISMAKKNGYIWVSYDFIETDMDSIPVQNRMLDQLPNTSINNPNGGFISLSSYKSNGKLLLIEFWTSWCSPCLEDIPVLKKLNDEYHDQLDILSINSDGKNLTKVKKLIKENKMEWPQGLSNKILQNTLDFKAYPQGFLFDDNGKLLMFATSPEKVTEYMDTRNENE
jgi:thiol-disulfide isomerase/thioredoxin